LHPFFSPDKGETGIRFPVFELQQSPGAVAWLLPSTANGLAANWTQCALERVKNVAGMMMAARKGKKLSGKDEEGALDDLAQLEALENEGDDAASPAERMLMGLGISEPKEIDLDAIAWTKGAVVNYRPMDGCEATIVGKGADLAANFMSCGSRLSSTRPAAALDQAVTVENRMDGAFGRNPDIAAEPAHQQFAIPRAPQCGLRGNHFALVQRTDRRADHPSQTRQTANVWPRETRSASGQNDWRPMK
jgi:hypothetical protein